MNEYHLDKKAVVFVRHAFYYDDLMHTFAMKDLKESSHRVFFILSKFCGNDFYENMPKTFTLTTKNSILHFNIDMLMATSPVISKFVKENPNENNYFINITDNDNILSKFAQLYQGKSIIFKEEEYPVIQRFTKLLQIINCPNELKPKSMAIQEIDSDGCVTKCSRAFGNKIDTNLDLIVEIYQDWFINFLKADEYQVFKIITNKKEYTCNIFAVYTSNVIRQILEKDPTVREFKYNFDDENDEFQLICDFFNYSKIDIKSVNIESLKSIAKDLQINCFFKFIDNYNNHNNRYNQFIEKHKNTIDSINELFELLYNIKLYGIEKVKNSIVKSKWSKNEESVQELAAFILQVVKPSFSLQKEMAELLIQLNKESNNDNQLHILIPFIVERLMNIYWPNNSFSDDQLSNRKIFNRVIDEIEPINLNNRCIYSFIRILYKRGIIPKEEIIKSLKNYNFYNNTFNAFFLPELVEINPINLNIIASINKNKPRFFYVIIPPTYANKNYMNSLGHNFYFYNFISKYFKNNKIESYEKILDNLEPDDELIKTIRNDDVDKLQKMVNDENIDIQTKTIEYNIFDDFEEDQTLINYSALNGSIKCFKYLMSNNCEIDESTHYYSIYGGNKEIIKIIEEERQKQQQQIKDKDNNNNNKRVIRVNIFHNYKSFVDLKFKKAPISFWFYFKKNYKKKKYSKQINYSFGVIQTQFDICDDDIIQYTKGSNINSISIMNCYNINNKIAPTIAFHQNELFDWAFQNLFLNNNKYGNELKYIADLSAINGNIHSLLNLIDNGFKISKNAISFAAKNGFYSLTKLLLDLYGVEGYDLFDRRSIVDFGSLSIFKLFIDFQNQSAIQKVILRAIKKNCMSIIKYVFESEKFDFIPFDDDFIHLALNKSLRIKSNLFDFLIDQFKKLNPYCMTFDLFTNLLNQACYDSNLLAIKTITDFIIESNPEYDFTEAFSKASSSRSSDICQYFIDKKVSIDFVNNSNISDLGGIDFELFEMIVNKVDPNFRPLFNECIHKAIQFRNIKVIEFILKENPPVNTELFEAIQTNDIEVVDAVLKYNSKPSFINQQSSQGTAIAIAVTKRNAEIVKRLLSIPEINLNLYNETGENPLRKAVMTYDYEIVNLFLNFYGDDIQYHIDSLYDAITYLTTKCDTKVVISDNEWKIWRRICEVKYFNINTIILRMQTILSLATFYDKLEFVEFLLKLENVDPNVYSPSTFNTPLMVALNNKNVKMAELLIKHPKKI